MEMYPTIIIFTFAERFTYFLLDKSVGEERAVNVSYM
jgi:hypothetical protein